MASIFNLRNALASLVPAWLYNDDGGKVLHALATLIDASVQLDRDRTEVRFPRKTSPSANRLTGVDRGIQRGRTETAAHYAERLIRWRYPRGHRVRSSAWALLEQVSEYFGGLQTSTIDVKGNRYTRLADGTESRATGLTWVWDAVSASSWARFWLTLYTTATGPLTKQKDITDPTVWGDGTLGLRGMTTSDASAIRNLFQRAPTTVPWHPCGSTPMWVIVAFDGVDVVPNSGYARWSASIGGVQEKLRDNAFRYFALVPSAHPYVELSAEYVDFARLPDGAVYPGTAPVSWVSTVTFPDGAVHTDKVNPTFVLDVLLPDDASAVQGS